MLKSEVLVDFGVLGVDYPNLNLHFDLSCLEIDLQAHMWKS